MAFRLRANIGERQAKPVGNHGGKGHTSGHATGDNICPLFTNILGQRIGDIGARLGMAKNKAAINVEGREQAGSKPERLVWPDQKGASIQ